MSRRCRAIVILIAAALLAGGGFLHLHAVASRQNRFDAMDREARALRQGGPQRDLREDIARLRQRLAAPPATTPADDDVADLLHRLTDDLNDLEVRDRSLTTGATHVNGSVQRIPVTMNFTTSFATVFEMLERLRSYERIIRVSRLVLRREPQARADEISASAHLDAFMQPRGEID